MLLIREPLLRRSGYVLRKSQVARRFCVIGVSWDEVDEHM